VQICFFLDFDRPLQTIKAQSCNLFGVQPWMPKVGRVGSQQYTDENVARNLYVNDYVGIPPILRIRNEKNQPNMTPNVKRWKTRLAKSLIFDRKKRHNTQLRPSPFQAAATWRI